MFILSLLNVKCNLRVLSYSIIIISIFLFGFDFLFKDKIGNLLPKDLDYKAYKFVTVKKGVSIKFEDEKNKELILGYLTNIEKRKNKDGRLIYYLSFIPNIIVDRHDNIFFNAVKPLEIELEIDNTYVKDILYISIYVKVEQILGNKVLVLVGAKHREIKGINMNGCSFHGTEFK